MKTLTPRNLTKMAVGQAKYVPIVDDNGGIINDPVMLRLGENHFWFSLADSDVLLWAKGVAIGCNLDVTLGEPDVSPLQIQGPKSSDVVRDLFGDWVLDLKYYWFKETELDGIPLVLARTGWSNERGYELFLRDRSYGVKLWDMVMAAGKPYNIAVGTPSQIKRIEAGLLSYGNDMTLENNPYEIGLGKFVNLKQEAEFIGKAALKRIKAEGIKRKLVGVELHAEQPLPVNEHHWPVRHNADAAGTLTRAVWSPSLEMNIAYVMTPIEYTEIGTKLTVETPWADVRATVCPLPFVNNRARGKSK